MCSARFLAGNDAELGRQGLHHHGHQIGPHYHPQQLIAESGSRLDIGGEVAGIYVTDGSDKGRPEQGQLEFAGRNGRGQCGLHGITLHKDMEKE